MEYAFRGYERLCLSWSGRLTKFRRHFVKYYLVQFQLSGDSAEWSGGGREAELARPLTAGEEELQLQLALAMSREEAEREERRRRSDDVRLQLAISQSQQDFQ